MSTIQELKEAIRTYKRNEVYVAIEDGILTELPEEEQAAVYQSIFKLRDLHIVEGMAKKIDVFKPEYIELNFGNHQDSTFIKEVLHKYKKKFNLNNEQVCNKLFDIACQVGAKNVLIDFIKEKKAENRYAKLGAANDEIFALVSRLQPKEMACDVKVELYLCVAEHMKGAERLEKLYRLGFDLEQENNKKETLEILLENRIKNAKNTGKRADLSRVRDQKLLTKLRKLLEGTQEKKSWFAKPYVLAGGGVLLLAVIWAIAFLVSGPEKGEGKGSFTTSQENGSESEKTEKEEVVLDAIEEGKEYTAQIDIQDYGTIKVALDAEAAPITVNNFVKLANSDFYNGLTFHRIMKGFMMQGGDPKGNGTGGSKENITGEFSLNGYDNKLSHTRGAISMARSENYDSASSQFFIVHEDSTFLDGQYAVFGYVTEGIEVVDAVCKAAKPTDDNGTIKAKKQPIIKSITIHATDAAK